VTADHRSTAERISTVVIGGGQAGLSIGYHLARRGVPCVILDANRRIGDSWRNRWDSLRLFTRADLAGLDGMSFPGAAHAFPTKNEMADFLEAYATRFDLPVRRGVHVDGVSREDGRYVVRAGDRRFEADNVVVATGGRRHPHVPSFAGGLSPSIVQLHSSAYQNPGQLRQGDVLVVGAGNSGAEIARDIVSHGGRRVLLSGRDTGHIPFNVDGFLGRHLLVPVFISLVSARLLTTDTAIGRKVRPVFLSRGAPLVRVKPRQLAALGVKRVPRTEAATDGLPALADGHVVDTPNVVWCTGFRLDFTWIDLPTIADQAEPRHQRGVVKSEPGLYFVGLPFQYSLASELIKGVGRDAQYIAGEIAARVKSG
jgi:putative flavoprotein involved in K+ transport